jgi:hypothetical protein
MANPQFIDARIDFRVMGEALDATIREMKLGAATSINRSLMKARTQATREIAQNARIAPQRVVRRRMKIDRAKPNALVGTLRVGIREVSVAHLAGAMDTGEVGRSERRAFSDQQVGKYGLRRQMGSGVKAYGGRHYPDAFLAKGRGDVWMAFRRQGKRRLPLEALKINIQEEARAAIARLMPLAGQWARDMLEREIKFRISKRKP